MARFKEKLTTYSIEMNVEEQIIQGIKNSVRFATQVDKSSS